MPEPFFNIPKTIVRRDASLMGGGNNPSEELTLIDLGTTSFVLQMASVMIMEDEPQENLLAFMVVRSPNPNIPPGPPEIIQSLSIPVVQSGHLKGNGAGTYVGIVQGPIPLKSGEKLCFQVQRKVGPGTYAFHAQAWGFATK
ncbi:hypothetical protein W02_24980 [Nitrospira sp. KM1]|uniref:hypothetical protein n=1 Tax=Nitrospira sp. KM1 TaxID=1936990 RepID=UPI0013A71A77|nr:hypothetical protein [Nitrospira sp. KM1]BCA55358.1 hypothetical protein W02_24980 [Nitrospira sp. KM1]